MDSPARLALRRQSRNRRPRLRLLADGDLDDVGAFRDVFAEALADDQPWVIVARIEPGDSPYLPSKNCVELRDRFKASLQPAAER